jgi:outer membrane protein OmpA-like peptidoglycan-associated protein
VPLAADAKGSPTAIAGGLRVTFGPDSSDLNPATDAAIRDLAARLKPQDTTTITINAYAAGTPDDASTARRLSLARALAARAVLINAGIPSTRIYPRALGAAGGDAGPDRVDVVAGPPGPPASIAPPHLPPPPDQKAQAK